MRIVAMIALAITAASLDMTDGAAQDATKETGAGKSRTLSGEIIKGHEDSLSRPGVPFDVPVPGSDPFAASREESREELAKNEEQIAKLKAEIDRMDKNATDYAGRYELLMSRIREYEKKSKEVQDFLTAIDD